MTYKPWRLGELDDVAPNGLRAISLFAGCGGSSLGYRRAGYRVVFANEFVPIAADTYKANCASYTVVDRKDIRGLDPEWITKHFGEIDLLDGSPPCASFSQAGKRSKDWGTAKLYSEGITQRTDDLFDEYARIVEGVKPRAFVAENVAGFSNGVAVGYARHILNRLRAAGYKVEARVLDACWLGVPQTRRRTYIVGVRDDQGSHPRFPSPLPAQVGLGEAIPGCRGELAALEYHGGAKGKGTRRSPKLPAHTLGATINSGSGWYPASIIFADSKADPETGWSPSVAPRLRAEFATEHIRYMTLDELRRAFGFPDDFTLIGSFTQRWERIGRSVPPFVAEAIGRAVAGTLAA